MSTIAVNSITPSTGSTVSIDSFVPAGQFGWRNKIINGDMTIAQRGTSFAAIASGEFPADRWRINYITSAVVTASQQSDVPSNNEFQSSLRVAVTTADASIAAGDFCAISQPIEGYNVRDLIGKTFTVSFWVRSSKTGTHCAAFRNVSDRSYVVEYTINAANTWEYKTITVSGGLITAGTWDWTTGIGLFLRFALTSGSNSQTTAGAWQTGNFLATANQVNCLDTIGNIFAITGVQLEVGAVATPFEHRPYGTELALCQRYYYRITDQSGYATLTCGSATIAQGEIPFPVQMRIAPTALEQSGTAADYALWGGSAVACSSVPTHTSASKTAAGVRATVASGLTAGNAREFSANSASAYLGWSAEL